MDTDARTDKVWLLNVQRILYQWSGENPAVCPADDCHRAIERRLSTGRLSSNPILLRSRESRVRNERRMLGSGRDYGRPGVERPYGARSLLYSLNLSNKKGKACLTLLSPAGN